MRSFTADSTLPLPTEGVNTTPHTSQCLIDLHAHAWLKSCVRRARHRVSGVISIRSCVCSDSLRQLHFPLSADHLLSYHFVVPLAHHLRLPQRLRNSLCTRKRGLGTLCEYDPLTARITSHPARSKSSHLSWSGSSSASPSQDSLRRESTSTGWTGATCFKFIFMFSTRAKWRTSIQETCNHQKSKTQKKTSEKKNSVDLLEDLPL